MTLPFVHPPIERSPKNLSELATFFHCLSMDAGDTTRGRCFEAAALAITECVVYREWGAVHCKTMDATDRAVESISR